jgi:hypothetical protein
MSDVRLATTVLLLLLPVLAHAQAAVFAPTGEVTIRLPPGRVACSTGIDLQGWKVTPDDLSVTTPTAGTAPGAALHLPIAENAAGCAGTHETVTLTPIGPMPDVDWSTAVWDVDGGQLTVQGTHLEGSVLHWSLGEKSGDDSCPLPTRTGGKEECSYALDRALRAVPEELQLRILPAGARLQEGARLIDAAGRNAGWPVAASPAQALMSRLLPPDATADMTSGEGRVSVIHPEAISSVSCGDATCELDANSIAVYDEHGGDEKLDLQINLRPRLALRGGTPPRSPHFSLPLQRCPITLASGSVLRDLPDERVAIRVGGRCGTDASIEFQGPNGPAPVVNETRAGGARVVLIDIGRVSSDELVVTVRREGTIVGRVSHPVLPAPTPHVRLELGSLGPVPFIPTNRMASVVFPAAPAGLSWSIVPLPGLYDVVTTPGGVSLRGAAGASGAVSLRLELRDSSLPPPLNAAALGSATDPVVLPIHVAHVPISLSATDGTTPFAELQCADTGAHLTAMHLSATNYVPFSSRGTCRLVLHSERIPVEDGTQVIRVSVDVTSSDGGPKPDARLDRRLVLRPGDAAQTLIISGVDTPFDRARIQLAVEPDESLAERGAQSVSEAQWVVVFGTSRYRLYATVSFPTGLFRVSDQAHSGILSLNAGALVRGVLLSRDGQESVVGVEAGALWLAIPGDEAAAASAHGQAALVAGLSVGIPIANANRSAQTSINLHAWVEYEVSRAILREPGSPWGFIFGPSLTIGDVGRNF